MRTPSIRTRRVRKLICLVSGTGVLVVLLACLSVAQQQDIQTIVASGNLPAMRWPNFTDYRTALQKFYEPTGYAPAWVQGSQPVPQAQFLIDRFNDAWKKGLNPEDYDASRWAERISALKTGGAAVAQFDVALSVCTMRYISDLRIGRVNPSHFDFGLNVQEKKYDLAEFLRNRVVTAPDLQTVLDGVEPPFAAYRRTEQALARYVELARADSGGTLPTVTKPIDPGKPYAGVPRLVQFLQLVGDLPPGAVLPADPQIYSGPVVEAVKHFQRRHGLDADGRLGPATVKQLNVPLQDRVLQLQLTLERWRWLPAEFPAPPIIVNIPDFRLRVLDENNNVTMDMRVVVVSDAHANSGLHPRNDLCRPAALLERSPQHPARRDCSPPFNATEATSRARTTKSLRRPVSWSLPERFLMMYWLSCGRENLPCGKSPAPRMR